MLDTRLLKEVGYLVFYLFGIEIIHLSLFSDSALSAPSVVKTFRKNRQRYYIKSNIIKLTKNYLLQLILNYAN
jgi:lipopolysaccharide export system protein LptC